MEKNYFQQLKKKINKNKLIIGVIGLGYVGLPISLSFALKKFKVFGFDNDRDKINQLKNGKSYVHFIENKLLKKTNQLFFFPTDDYSKIKNCDAIIICVPTPINKKKKPVLKYIKDVILQIKKHIRKKQIIVLECTSYPGTTEDFFLPLLKKKKLEIGEQVFLGYSPEREDPGNKKFSLLKGNLPKVVSGYSDKCAELISLLYLKIINKIYKTENIKSAEFSKLLENIYRSVNISLINELTLISKKLKLNIYDIIKAAKSKPFGFSHFYPGPGVGGHCIPVDPYFLYWKAKKLGIDLKFIKLAGVINDERPIKLSNEIVTYLKKQKLISNNSRIVVYGVAYKKDSDDIRESPSIKILQLLNNFYKKIIICDPKISKFSKRSLNKYQFIENKSDYYKFDKDNDIAIIITNHSYFDYTLIRKKFKLVFDCRNSYNKKFNNVIQI